MNKRILILIFLAFAVFSSSSFAQKPRQEQLLNGLKLLMWSDAKADKITVRIRVHAGSAFDPQGKEGVMQMLSDNLFPNVAAFEFFETDLGGSLSVETTYDYIQIEGSSVADNDKFLSMIETLASAVANPVIDKETTAKLKDSHLKSLRVPQAPGYVADHAVAQRLFGTFPYGRPQNGTEDSIKKIDFADLIEAKQRFLTADNATVTISGNFNPSYGYKAVRRLFGAWLKSDKRVPSQFRQPDDPPAGLQTLPSPRADVAAIRFAVRGTARNGADMAASQVYAAILQNRLKARVPEAHSADVFVRSESHVQPGIILIGFAAGKNEVGTGNGKIDANDLVTKAISDTITDAEFQTARTTVAGKWTARAIEDLWLDADTYKIASVDADRAMFDKVTLADIRAFAERTQKSPMVSVLLNTPAN